MRLRRNEIEADELGYRPSITLLITVDLNLCSLSNLVRHNCQFDVDEALTKRQHLKQVTVPNFHYRLVGGLFPTEAGPQFLIKLLALVILSHYNTNFPRLLIIDVKRGRLMAK